VSATSTNAATQNMTVIARSWRVLLVLLVLTRITVPVAR